MTRPRHGGGRRWAARAAATCAIAGVAVLATAAAALADPGDVMWRDVVQRAPGSEDGCTALAVGPTGTVCVVGATAASPTAAPDVLVRAYGRGGSLLWRRVWTWPGRTRDTAAAVVRDRRGSYVVAGASGSCWLLLKYSSRGYLQWVRRGRGSFARAALTAVGVDPAGNVYAAGTATAAGGHDRLLLRKYSSAGSLRWQRTLGSSAGDVSAVALTLGGGDVYLAGTSATAEGASAALTVKYSRGGARRWVRRHAAEATDAARATGIAYAGGPVVCGWGGPPAGPDRGFVVHYDTAGARLWTGTSTAPGAGAERFLSLAVGRAGRVCVAGTAVSGTGAEDLTACFEAGALLWSATGPGAEAAAVCRAGDGFVVGSGADSFSVRRLDAAGAQVWLTAVAPDGLSDFRPAALRASGDTYLYAVGSAAVDGGGRAAVVVRCRP